MKIDNTEMVYGCLLVLQIVSAITVMWNVWIAFAMLMIACFGKGMLYQYEHSSNLAESKLKEKQ